MTTLAPLWQGLAEFVAGPLALAFIVALILAIAANALLFLGSAVVVLERFARGGKRFRNSALVTLVWAALLGLLDRTGDFCRAMRSLWQFGRRCPELQTP